MTSFERLKSLEGREITFNYHPYGLNDDYFIKHVGVVRDVEHGQCSVSGIKFNIALIDCKSIAKS